MSTDNLHPDKKNPLFRRKSQKKIIINSRGKTNRKFVQNIPPKKEIPKNSGEKIRGGGKENSGSATAQLPEINGTPGA